MYLFTDWVESVHVYLPSVGPHEVVSLQHGSTTRKVTIMINQQDKTIKPKIGHNGKHTKSICRINMGRDVQTREVGRAKRDKLFQSGARAVHPAATRHVPLGMMVLTPASVPEFTIPSLCPERQQALQTSGSRETTGVKNARRHTMPRPTHPSLLVRTLSCCCPFSEMHDLRFRNDLEHSATRAAMSLPHLSKITTPYGFVTLGESPCVSRRESLFFKENGHAACLSYYSFSEGENLVKAACGEASLHLQESCKCSESTGSAHFTIKSLRKRWLKCLLKNPWHR